MDSQEPPGLVDEVEEVRAGIARALRRYLNAVPFLGKGAFPLVFAPILLLGAYFQARGLWDAIRNDVALLTWTQTPAVVVSSGALSEERTQVMDGRAGGHASAVDDAVLDIRYRYTFKGKLYDSMSFGAGEWTAYSEDSGVSPAEWARQHPKGSVLKVYVNPSDPQVSAVNPAPTFTALAYMLVALPFTLIGLAGVLSDEAQSRLSFEAISVVWCALVFGIYAAGHAVTVGVASALAAFLLLVWALHRFVTNNPPSTIEEQLDAPPLDIEDFRP